MAYSLFFIFSENKIFSSFVTNTQQLHNAWHENVQLPKPKYAVNYKETFPRILNPLTAIGQTDFLYLHCNIGIYGSTRKRKKGSCSFSA